MVEDKPKKRTPHGPRARSKPKKRQVNVKSIQPPSVKRSLDSKVSFGKVSSEVINVNYTDTDSNEEIPTTGDELIKWTRERMSFSSTRSDPESTMSFSDEHEISLIPSAKKSRSDHKIIQKHIKKQKKPKSISSDKATDDDFFYQNTPGPLEDEVMFQWRLKKEEQKSLTKKKTKSEVTFNEPTLRVDRKSSASAESKKRRKTRYFSKKSLHESKKEAQKRIEMELEEQRQREESYLGALKKHQQDEDEDVLREQRNAETMKKIKRFEKERLEHIWDTFKKSEAEHYMNCEKFPLVTKCDQLTSFVKKWELDIASMDIAELGRTCNINLELLKRLKDLIFHTPPNQTEKMEQWKWTSEMLQNTQEEMLDRVLYGILSDIHKNLKIENLDYGIFEFKTNSFTLSIWLKLDWPISLPNPRKPALPNTNVHLSEVDLICILPQSLQCDKKAIICLYFPYDHLSDSCTTYHPPPKPDAFTKDLCESNYEEKLLKRKYAFESYLRAQYRDKVDIYKEKHPEEKYPTPFVLPEIPISEDIPKVPVQYLEPSPQEYVELADDLRYNTCMRNMYKDVAQDEINLREYLVIGGLYNLQLVYHPPQPQPLVRFFMTLRTDKPPKKLQSVPFYSKFHPPPLPWLQMEHADTVSHTSKTSKTLKGKRLTARYGSKTDARKGGGFDPQELQKFKEAQEEWEKNVQLEKEKMLFISLGLPENVIYLEKPTVCLWDEESKIWTAKDIYEVDHEPDERRITFRSSRFGLISLCVRKYLNYPYKSWDIRPTTDDTISVVLEGAKVTIKLIIKESEISITDFEYRMSQYLVGNNGLNCLIHKSMSLSNFMQTLNSAGLDMFPDYDANSYYTTTTEKHWSTAYVTYYAMAQTAIRYNFCSSRWNSETGRRSIILRLREYDPQEEISVLRPFDLVQVTPLRCQVLTCTEDDEIFFDEGTPPHKFQPNLQYLLKSMTKVNNRAKIKEFSPNTIDTLAKFLIYTRIFSFS